MQYFDTARPKQSNGLPCWESHPAVLPMIHVVVLAEPAHVKLLGMFPASSGMAFSWKECVLKQEHLSYFFDCWRENPEKATLDFFDYELPKAQSGQSTGGALGRVVSVSPMSIDDF